MNEKRKVYLEKYMNILGRSDVIFWDPSFLKFISLDVKNAKRIEQDFIALKNLSSS